MRTILRMAITAIMALTVVGAVAQPNSGNERYNRENRAIHRDTHACLEGLELTQEQRDKIIDYYAEMAKKRPQPLRLQTERGERPTDEQFKKRAAEMDKLHKEFEKNVKSVLTKEQITKWEENRENLQKRIEERRELRNNRQDYRGNRGNRGNFERGRGGEQGRIDRNQQMRCPNCNHVGNFTQFKRVESKNKTSE